MKSMEKNYLALIGGMVCCFSFGLAKHSVNADPIPTCSQSSCESLYSWDPGPVISGAFSAQVPGATYPFALGSNTTNGITNVYLPVASCNGCNAATSGTFDRWIWPGCYFSCQSSAGVYPTPQQVSPYGTPTLDSSGKTRTICKSSN